jgi:hypothetical protein
MVEFSGWVFGSDLMLTMNEFVMLTMGSPDNPTGNHHSKGIELSCRQCSHMGSPPLSAESFRGFGHRSWVAFTSKEFVPDPHLVLWDVGTGYSVQRVPRYRVRCLPLEQAGIYNHHKMDTLFHIVLAGLHLSFRLAYA